MDELTQSEREQLMSWRTMAPPAGFTDRVIAAQPAYRRRRLAMASALAVAAAAAVVIVLARPSTPDAPPSVAPVIAPQVGGGPTANPPAAHPAKRDLVVTLPLHPAQPGVRSMRVFDTRDASGIVFRVDLTGSRCASWSLQSVSVNLTPDLGEVRMLASAGNRLILESDVISVPRGSYEVDVKCGGAAETAVEVQRFDLVVTPWQEPRDPDSVVVHLDPKQPFEISYAYSVPRLIFGDEHSAFDFDVYAATHSNVRPSRRRMPTWSRHGKADALVMTDDVNYEVDVRQGGLFLGTIVIRRDQAVAHLHVRTVNQTSTERGLQITGVSGANDWNELKTDSALGRFNCTDCRLSYTIFEEADFPLVRALSSPEYGDQYYVIR